MANGLALVRPLRPFSSLAHLDIGHSLLDIGYSPRCPYGVNPYYFFWLLWSGRPDSSSE